MTLLPNKSRRLFAAALWITLFACAPLSALAANPTKAKDMVLTETRQLDSFSGVSLSLPAHVEVRIGNANRITLEGDERALALTETIVKSGTLQIRSKKWTPIAPTPKIVVLVTRQIDHLAVSGSGSIDINVLHPPQLKLEVSGSGSIDIGVLHSPQLKLKVGGSGSINVKQVDDAELISASIAGSGSAKLAGTVQKLSAQLLGSSKLAATQLKAQDISAKISGSGQASVWASSVLEASITGSGQVRYLGNPAVHASVAGSGTVRPIAAGVVGG